ncbi:glycerophosphodiester phosphodiesterase family protein [Micromonospora sp. NPDC047467]|uniref:glycerophosphodiester phosphodiesterase family protein n=1 Tax=Micromonospora sp. NPDC047467 TaxID=3154814 RepID=UPI00340E673E
MRRVRRTAIAALVAATVTTGLAVPAQAKPRPDRTFDVQAHRGGLGLRVENTLASFGNALQLGVTTLELDVQITENGQACAARGPAGWTGGSTGTWAS